MQRPFRDFPCIQFSFPTHLRRRLYSTMAVISPALVVALCVMFFFTRVHTIRYTFEHIFFFGLRFCVEPSRAQLAALLTKKGSTSVASLPVQRIPLTPAFFATEDTNIPYLQSFDHLLAVVIGYTCGVVFEEVTSCLWPSTFKDSHVWWLALFAIVFSSSEAIRVCGSLESYTSPLIAGAAGALVALGGVVRLDVAFDAFTRVAKDICVEKLKLSVEDADQISGRLALLVQILTAINAGALAAAALFPALHFARLDVKMLKERRRDPLARKNDPWALSPRGIFAVFLVAFDYALPFSALTAGWLRIGNLSGQLITLFLSAVMRFVALRMRLQLHLDSAVEAFRDFWAERPALGIIPAGDRLRYKVAHKAWSLTAVGFAAIANPVAVISLVLATKRNGAVSAGLCPVHRDTFAALAESDTAVFVREISAFLAAFATGAYLLWGWLGASYILISGIFEGRSSAAAKEGKNIRPLSSSEKRRQKRNMRKYGSESVLQEQKQQ